MNCYLSGARHMWIAFVAKVHRSPTGSHRDPLEPLEVCFVTFCSQAQARKGCGQDAASHALTKGGLVLWVGVQSVGWFCTQFTVVQCAQARDFGSVHSPGAGPQASGLGAAQK